ncbi:hypothetical protein, partial [Lactiplantibacillus pentosus]|uniref:hypothetical protein n=1 Tax=Lactiplantibacillus pentosus TaxID=1589 RepID=UPI0021A9067E
KRDKVEVPKVITPYSWLELTTTIVRDCFGPFSIFVRINYRICHMKINNPQYLQCRYWGLLFQCF